MYTNFIIGVSISFCTILNFTKSKASTEVIYKFSKNKLSASIKSGASKETKLKLLIIQVLRMFFIKLKVLVQKFRERWRCNA